MRQLRSELRLLPLLLSIFVRLSLFIIYFLIVSRSCFVRNRRLGWVILRGNLLDLVCKLKLTIWMVGNFLLSGYWRLLARLLVQDLREILLLSYELPITLAVLTSFVFVACRLRVKRRGSWISIGAPMNMVVIWILLVMIDIHGLLFVNLASLLIAV